MQRRPQSAHRTETLLTDSIFFRRPWRRSGIVITVTKRSPSPAPHEPRRPEIIHGLSNLLQNAMEFATSRVDVELHWHDRRIPLDILDDGPGLNVDILSALGEPYVTSRHDELGRAPV